MAQALLAERVYTEGKLDPEDYIMGEIAPEYYFYGFDSKIEGISFRTNIYACALGWKTHEYYDIFFDFLIREAFFDYWW